VALPKDIEWHFIGTLQTNKIKYILPFVSLIQSVDSYRLLEEINRQAAKENRTIACLLQLHIATEETKHGFTPAECKQMLTEGAWRRLKNIQLCGMMGMATFTENQEQVEGEFRALKHFFDEVKRTYFAQDAAFCELSIGMSDDYSLAIRQGSTMVRIGTKLFGDRNI
ncbi:MAG: YggS family pyridoxal phosphate-dependent enzyme, partial [Prevotellaceae bacterium]|nr:YggS family pyridoxal phosphate-dependent enzyme [Prevotellaceae bacterium]